MTIHYTWNVDTTQSENLEVSIMIYDGGVDLLSSNYIGTFSMFFENINEVARFLADGVKELKDFTEIMEELKEFYDSSTSKEIGENNEA